MEDILSCEEIEICWGKGISMSDFQEQRDGVIKDVLRRVTSSLKVDIR